MVNKQVAPCTDPGSIGDAELIQELFSRYNCVVFVGLKDSRGQVGNNREDRVMQWKSRTMFETLGLLDYSRSRMHCILHESEDDNA